jgi:alpha-L-fucosidase
MAIYGTLPWVIFGEGPPVLTGGFTDRKQKHFTSEDIRFHEQRHAGYAYRKIALDWPGKDANH